MKIIKLIIITTLLSLFLIIPSCLYVYNKTIGYDKTDCMIQYVQNYYPNGCTYIIFGEQRHIDKCGIGNNYMIETKKIDGCLITDDISSFIINTPYCYYTLFFEKNLGKIY